MNDEEYASARARVERELQKAVDAVWGSLIEFRSAEYGNTAPDWDYSRVKLPDKAYGIVEERRFMEGSVEKKRISILNDLHLNAFWRCSFFWDDVSPALSDDDRAFYARFMIEQAKRADETEKISRLGYTWIVEQYDNGKLRAFIDDALLAEAVNRGFWEIINGYFNSEYGGAVPPWKSFEILRRYAHLLDLTRFREFKKDEMYGQSAWPEDTYVDAYGRAKASGKLGRADLGILAKPIIEQAVEYAFSYEYDAEEMEPEEYLKKELKPYSDVMRTPAVQKLLKHDVAHYVGAFELYAVEVLLDLVKGTKQKKQELVSRSLDRENYRFEQDMIENKFPSEWLTDDAKAYVQSRLVKAIDKEYSEVALRALTKKFTEHIGFIRRGKEYGLLEEGIAKEKIERALKFYVEAKRRPGGEIAREVNALKLPDYVDTGIAEKVRGMAAVDGAVSAQRSAEARERFTRRMRGWTGNAAQEEGVQRDFTDMLRGESGKTKSKSKT